GRGRRSPPERDALSRMAGGRGIWDRRDAWGSHTRFAGAWLPDGTAPTGGTPANQRRRGPPVPPNESAGLALILRNPRGPSQEEPHENRNNSLDGARNRRAVRGRRIEVCQGHRRRRLSLGP